MLAKLIGIILIKAKSDLYNKKGNIKMSSLIGKKAPDFKVNAVVNGKIVSDFTLSQFEGKKYVVFFFYPKDFTFVCPTEILAFQKSLKDFEDRDVQVIGCSTDSEFSHLAWVNTERNNGGITGVTYPLVADINKTISADYGVLAGETDYDDEGKVVVSGELVAYRGLFLIDKQGIVQHAVVNNFPLGRSIKEELRMVDALQHVEKYGEVCPMNWEKGKEAIKATHEGISEYIEKNL